MSSMPFDVSRLNEITQSVYGFSTYDWKYYRGKTTDGQVVRLITQPRKIKKHCLPLILDRIANYLNSYVLYELSQTKLDKNRIQLFVRNPVEGEFYSLFIYTSEKINFKVCIEVKTDKKPKEEKTYSPFKISIMKQCYKKPKITPPLRRKSLS